MKAARLFLITLLLASTSAAHAQERIVDWKVYGVGKIDESEWLFFYDAKGITQTQNGTVKVWTKTLRTKDVETFVKKGIGRKIDENIAHKLVDRYLSSLSKIMDADFDQNTRFILYEEIADSGRIQPISKIFYELYCSENMIRELSIHFNFKGKTRSIDQPEEWEYVLPESVGMDLIKLLCSAPPKEKG